MSKKKHKRTAPVTSPADQSRPADDQPATPSALSAAISESVASTASTPESCRLLDEVQSFLAAREELAKKLASEIAATEKKLAELKKTAALLFPAAAAAPAGAKEKKPKKAKARPVSQPDPSESSPVSTEEAATSDAA
jgi:hypothetical protein